jgi:hypothetical protein
MPTKNTNGASELPFLIALGDLPAGLVSLPILKLGTFYKGKQKFSLTDQDVHQVVANFRKRENGEVVIDFEHASERPEVSKGGPIPAAGWLKALSDTADANGILWGQAELTDETRTLIAEKKYKYLSPFIDRTLTDKTTGKPQGSTLTSLALTNRPFLEGMPAIALSEGWAFPTIALSEGWAAGGAEEQAEISPDKAIAALVSQKRIANRNLRYDEALRLVLSERPELVERWHKATPTSFC